MLVVDASVLVPFLADEGPDGERSRRRLRGQSIAGPDLLRLEVLSVLRRHSRTGTISPSKASAAIDDLLDLPISVFPTSPLLRRCWELRSNISAYDACYVALAEVLDSTLLTADARLANAPGSRCAIEVVGP